MSSELTGADGRVEGARLRDCVEDSGRLAAAFGLTLTRLRRGWSKA